MFTTQTTETTLLMPQDTDVPDRLSAMIDAAKTSVRFIIYGATLPVFFDALIRAHQRGLDVQGIFDHTQSTGRTEAAQLHRLFLAIPPDRFRIGTSSEAHQIVHLKGLWVNWVSGQQPPVGQQFDRYEDAFAAAYPVVWSGSYNFSPDAVKQINHVDIQPGFERAQAFQAAFDALWAWISTNEPQYQPAAA